jgi:hypothetical protein
LPSRQLTLLVTFIFGSIALSSLLILLFLKTSKEPFDDKPLHAIVKERPEVVLIGNSMLETRIDVRAAGKELDRKTYSLGKGGSAIARWYLALKNYVVPARPLPKCAIIFFRDIELVNTSFRTTGNFKKKVEGLSNGDEPVLRKAIARTRNWREKRWNDIGKVYPGLKIAREASDNLVFELTQKAVSKLGYRGINRYMRPRFSIKGLRADLGGDLGNDFDTSMITQAAIDKSLLPDIFDLARRANIKLVFYRVMRQTNPSNEAAVQNLISYLRQNGAVVFSEKDIVPEITKSWYVDGDHIKGNYKKLYSELFGSRLKGQLP